MAIDKIKPLDDFLTGARTYNPLKKTTDDEFVVHPIENYLACGIYAGAPLGNWQTIRDLFAAAGQVMPVGARVLGGNGKIYAVGAGGNGMADPVLGGAGWTDVSAGGSGATGTTPTTFSSDAPPDPAKVKVGDMWKTGGATAAPHPKNCVMVWDGSRWMLQAGSPSAVVAEAVSYSGTGWKAVNLTEYQNDIGGSTSGTEFSIGAPGVYDIVVQINPGSALTWAGAAQADWLGTALQLLINGTNVTEGYNVNFAGPIAASPFPAAHPLVISNIGNFFNAGDKLSVKLFHGAPGGSFSGAVNMRVVRRS
ncbi:hypothetical protein VSS37_03760 [Candidatus Thiothrix sp. Deng01]|uniref:Tail fiber protein n=1 Tax=Candidatus Thiothrix phosphatis TaxID=3112415 RepID=A0ABU6CU94_9GAMM|nr:hypothetical protein [Candidatus Thiothrix sp. Deng01]MEB4590087.1 hypothetical protein [Candidatus Thiothrix sp. Deng01]